MSSNEFYIDALDIEIKRVLRKQPDLVNNPNGILLAVWRESGLKLKRRQNVPAFLLPSIDDVFNAVAAIVNEENQPLELGKVKQSKDAVDGMKYELTPKPKTLRKKRSIKKKISVK